MCQDEIIAEMWRIRDEYAAGKHYDRITQAKTLFLAIVRVLQKVWGISEKDFLRCADRCQREFDSSLPP